MPQLVPRLLHVLALQVDTRQNQITEPGARVHILRHLRARELLGQCAHHEKATNISQDATASQ